MFTYLLKSFQRKLARRITRKHPTAVDVFDVPGAGRVRFANWTNPLVEKKVLSAETVGFFQQFLRPGDLAIDIGANIGHMTVQMVLATGPDGLTLGFDPNPYVFEILAQNAALNPGIGRIVPYNLAITDHDDEFFYHSSEASFNNGGISATGASRHGKFALSHKVPGVNLEAFLEREYPADLGRLRLIKIDTEGYDKEIIRSIAGLLAKYRPVLLSECFGRNTAAEKVEQFELVRSLGYSLHYVSDFRTDAEVVAITQPEHMLKWKHFDFYALPNA